MITWGGHALVVHHHRIVIGPRFVPQEVVAGLTSDGELWIVGRTRCVVEDRLAARVWRMGSWWSIQVGGQAIPVWGKNYVPDELMLLFAEEDRFVDNTKLAAWAEYENRAATAPARVSPRV
jgi:hypothetical protein